MDPEICPKCDFASALCDCRCPACGKLADHYPWCCHWTYDYVTCAWWRFYELGRWVAYVTKEQLAKL